MVEADTWRVDSMSEAPFECEKTLWALSTADTDEPVVPAAFVEVTGDYNSVEVYVQRGPTVMLTLEKNGSFTVSIFDGGSNVLIQKAVDNDSAFVECRPIG